MIWYLLRDIQLYVSSPMLRFAPIEENTYNSCVVTFQSFFYFKKKSFPLPHLTVSIIS